MDALSVAIVYTFIRLVYPRPPLYMTVGELFESGAGSSSFRRPSFPGNVSRRRKRQASDRVSASSFIEEEDVFMEPHKVFRRTPGVFSFRKHYSVIKYDFYFQVV